MFLSNKKKYPLFELVYLKAAIDQILGQFYYLKEK